MQNSYSHHRIKSLGRCWSTLCLALLLLGACSRNTVHQTYQGLDPIALHQSLQPSVSNDRCPYIEGENGYRLGTSDKINIAVFNEKDLSGEYVVQDSGIVNIPLIPEVNLSGCTIRQVEQILFEEFTQGFLVNPSIAVTVSKYGPFYIIGEVKEPGRFDYAVNMNTLEAVAMAGGFTYRANKNIAKVLTGRQSGKPTYEDMNVEKQINPGDIIIIKERFF